MYKQMKLNLYILIIISSIVSVAFSCGSSRKNISDIEAAHNLKEKKLDRIGYYISIPQGYKIVETEGVDFYVYHFQPKDTTTKNLLTGGLYYGGYPSEMEPEDKSCKTEVIEADLLNKNVDWQVFDCNNAYSVQTIIELDDWAKFHAFGNAQSEEDVQTLIEIYSTLRKK